MGAIRYRLKYLKECGYKAFNTLFKTGVLTIADYSAGVWGTKQFPKTEQVQYKAARYFLGVHRFAPIEALLGDMGWNTARSRHKLLMLKYWNRLCLLPSNRITKIVFNWDCEQFSNKKGCWSYSLKHLLREVHSPDSFDAHVPCDIDFCETILNDCDATEWDVKRYKSEKLRYYNLYKFDREPADYVFFNVSKFHRSLFAQFRAGILPLEIEVGRYRNALLKDRICKLCTLNIVEEEIHFLCDCTKYVTIRNILYVKIANTNPLFQDMESFDKFVYLMSNHEAIIIRYIANAVKIRRDCIYNVLNS